MTAKTVAAVRPTPQPHWVGDGFPVHSVFSAHELGGAVSPFLLFDHAGPYTFPPAQHPRGVGEHPHKGFETVTIAYSGAVNHRDSAGNHGSIGPGDVQWMTAAGGVVHEELHGDDLTRNGGLFEMVQLWVNLPAAYKGDRPSYQELAASAIPTVALPGGATARVIAGTLDGSTGPARTHTHVDLFDVRIPAGAETSIALPAGHNSMFVVLEGRAEVDGRAIQADQLVMLSRDGDTLALRAVDDAKLLVLSGEPIEEPIVAHGPFVMNTEAEIREAFDQYRTGGMGHLAPLAGAR